MIKLVLFFAGLGVMFGVGFLVGRVTDWVPTMDKSTDTVQLKETALKEVKKRLELTYYSELIKKPEEAAEPEPEPVTQTTQTTQIPAAPVETTSTKATPDKMAQALAKVLGSETPNSVKTAIKDTLPSGTGSAFAIQVASLPNREGALELVKRLEKKGYAAKLVQAELPGRGKVYRVRIHGFSTREEADAYRIQKGIEGITVGQ